METDFKRALTNILDYLEDEEKEDYEKSPDDDHIYMDVCLVRGWLDAAVKNDGMKRNEVNRTYRIPVTELLVSHGTVTVRARSAEEAREKVDRGEGRYRSGNVETPRVMFDNQVEPELRRMADHFAHYRKTRDR
jgi:hypothetical protein